mmetsp:Transcript_15136/g.17535  ORF Transcript_15136/g.17535 Transcript_15136/m.17535 type:complete len:146 (-) Transcript_15136:326-763(-)
MSPSSLSDLRNNRVRSQSHLSTGCEDKVTVTDSKNERRLTYSSSPKNHLNLVKWKGFNDAPSLRMKQEIENTKLRLNFIDPKRVQILEDYKKANKSLFAYRKTSGIFKLGLIKKSYCELRKIQKQRDLPRRKILILKTSQLKETF